jgi:hypothetical protein
MSKGLLYCSMAPKDRRELKKLIRCLRDPKLMKDVRRGVALESASGFMDGVRGRLEAGGAGDLARSMELVEVDGAAGVAVLPKRKSMRLSDFESNHAVYVFPKGVPDDTGLLDAFRTTNPWPGKSLPWLPPESMAVVVVREVTSDEVSRLEALVKPVRAAMIAGLSARGQSIPQSEARTVWVDVGFAGRRAEKGIGRSGVIGAWRKQVSATERGVSPAMRRKIEKVLFEGEKWNLTTSGVPRKMRESEVPMVLDFQDEIT